MQLATFARGIRIGTRAGSDALFHEEQPFRRPNFLMVLGLASIAGLAIVICQAMPGNLFAAKTSLSKNVTVGWTALLWLLFARLATVSMITHVKQGELSVGVRGLRRSCRIPIALIKSAHPVTFDPERECGGYGIRATRCARTYTVTGDRGVRVELRDGGALVIGSRHPQQLAKAICDQLCLEG